MRRWRADEDEHEIAQLLTEIHETDEVTVQATLERSLWKTSIVDTREVSSDFPIPPLNLFLGTDAWGDASFPETLDL